MTPKEKAEELVDKMYYSRRYESSENYIPQNALEHAKQCALIAVDEIIDNVLVGIDLAATWGDYWNKVKQEIEKL